MQHIKLGDYVECLAVRGRVMKKYIRGTQRGFQDRVIIRTRDGELSDVPVERCAIVRSLDERMARLREFWSAN